MTDLILTVNAGSSSIKFALFGADRDWLSPTLKGQAEGIGLGSGAAASLKISDDNGKLLHDAALGGKENSAPTHVEAMAAILNWLASYLTERPIPDLTSGFRVARRDYLLEFIHMLPNGFSTPTTTTLAFMKAGYNVTFEPIEARQRTGKSKIRLASDGAKFLLILLKIITIFSPLRIFAPISALAFTVGATYGAWNFVYHARIPNGAVLALMFSIMVLLVGLVSEQIATLRFEGRR